MTPNQDDRRSDRSSGPVVIEEVKVPFHPGQIVPEVLSKIDERTAASLRVVPVKFEDGQLVLAAENPADFNLQDGLRFKFDGHPTIRRIGLTQVSREDLNAGLLRYQDRDLFRDQKTPDLTGENMPSL